MPNIRKRGKKFVGAWIPQSLYEKLRILAAQRGQPVSEIMQELLADYTERYVPTARGKTFYPAHAPRNYALNETEAEKLEPGDPDAPKRKKN